MMMKLNKLLAAVLALALLLGLTACGGDDASAKKETQDPAAVTSPSPSAGESEGEEEKETVPAMSGEEKSAFYRDSLAGYTQRVAGLEPDDVIMTINGEEITAELYLYWLTYDCMYWDAMSRYMYGNPLNFGAEGSNGITYREFVKDDALQMLLSYVVTRQHAETEGCAQLTDEQQKDWDDQTAAHVAQYGEADLDYMYAQSGMGKELFTAVQTHYYLYDNLCFALCGSPSEADLDDYIEAYDLLRAKHILLCTGKEGENGKVLVGRNGDEATNEDGTPFTGTAEEYNAMIKEKVDGIYAQLKAAADPIALFDELMHEHSEDPGLESSPDGYDFTANQMVPEFEQGTRDLEYNEIGAPVQTDDGYHIILRLKPDALEAYQNSAMEFYMNNWMYSAEVEYTELYEPLDAEAIYNEYTLYQEELIDVRNR